jgi:hypothetical protein
VESLRQGVNVCGALVSQYWRENWSTGRKTCSIATFSITNSQGLTWNSNQASVVSSWWTTAWVMAQRKKRWEKIWSQRRWKINSSNTIQWCGMNNDGIQVELLNMKINGKHQRGIFRSRLEIRWGNMLHKRYTSLICCIYCTKAVRAVQQLVSQNWKQMRKTALEQA